MELTLQLADDTHESTIQIEQGHDGVNFGEIPDTSVTLLPDTDTETTRKSGRGRAEVTKAYPISHSVKRRRGKRTCVEGVRRNQLRKVGAGADPSGT